MANRACPLCFTRVPRTFVLCRSEELECPACHALLEISRTTRVLGSAAGVATAFAVLGLMEWIREPVAWSMQVVVACVGFGMGAAIFLIMFSELVVRANPAKTLGTFPHR